MKSTTVSLQKVFPELALEDSAATLTSYIGDLNREIPQTIRPSVLIIPGGGYDFCSQREGEPVALYFLAQGFNAYVLEYSTQGKVNRRFPSQLFEAMSALKFIKRTCKEHAGSESSIHVIGFSAGGHLAGTLAFMGNLPKYKTLLGVEKEDLSLASASLIYPVVSTLVNTHARSFENIESSAYPKEELGLEKYVDANSPSLFMAASSNDDAVPIANSLLLAHTYAQLKKPFELHIYEKAPHGFSLANELVFSREIVLSLDPNIQDWISLCAAFMRRQSH